MNSPHPVYWNSLSQIWLFATMALTVYFLELISLFWWNLKCTCTILFLDHKVMQSHHNCKRSQHSKSYRNSTHNTNVNFTETLVYTKWNYWPTQNNYSCVLLKKFHKKKQENVPYFIRKYYTASLSRTLINKIT